MVLRASSVLAACGMPPPDWLALGVCPAPWLNNSVESGEKMGRVDDVRAGSGPLSGIDWKLVDGDTADH